MAAENNKKLTDEAGKKIHEALDDYYDRYDDRMEAIDDSYLDRIAGGEFNPHDGHKDSGERFEDSLGYTVIKYFGTDTCSECGSSKTGVFYSRYTSRNRLTLCEDCAKKIKLFVKA